MDLKETSILGNEIDIHWYYSSKAKAVTKMLLGIDSRKILDVGAGSGFFSRYLLSHTTAKEAWCVDTSYAVDSDVNSTGKFIHYRRSVDAVDADLVLLMDVLEHVDDDVALLKEYVQKVPRGSQFLITVPAFNFLWSGHDDFLEHKRRYTISQLENAVQSAGLAVKQGNYYFAMVFPIAATVRLAEKINNDVSPARSQLKRHHPMINSALKFLCQIELPFMNFNRAFGLTVFCLAERQ